MNILWLRRYVAVYFTALLVRYRYGAVSSLGTNTHESYLRLMRSACLVSGLAICVFPTLKRSKSAAKTDCEGVHCFPNPCCAMCVYIYNHMCVWLCRSGIITKEMLQAPDRKLFLWIGGLEALSQLLGFIGASKLPGVVLPLLQQSLLIWQVTLAYLVLNKRLDSVQVTDHSCRRKHDILPVDSCREPWPYPVQHERAPDNVKLAFPVQIAGALLVVAGVVTAAWPNQGASVFTEVSMTIIPITYMCYTAYRYCMEPFTFSARLQDLLTCQRYA